MARRGLSLQEMLDFIQELDEAEDQNQLCDIPTTLYIEPPVDANESGEDDPEDDCAGIPDNVCPAQLRAPNPGDLPVIEVEDTYNEMEDEETTANRSESPMRKRLRTIEPKPSNVALPSGNKETVFEWVKKKSSSLIPIFPSANYEDCRHSLPHEQFEKFFDDTLLEHICQQSALYSVEQNRRRAFIGILIVTGYNYHSNYKHLWSQDEDIRNNLVSNTMRRNRFQEILQNLHFEENSKASSKDAPNPDKMWKLRPLTDHLKAKMIENFHPEQNLSFDEKPESLDPFGRHDPPNDAA
ncbi:piggyBac transposable element-derived protein 3-like [Anastrepha obliqua]|uniref:piggyBac transposable element-derived protein 3-like n=1 Tax=Anastrepha obliqua TaxID=95512 RepID=UPI00240A6447|nr:piggyBac transposable element-derived protein 3-like [Anastrepha obliqua]